MAILFTDNALTTLATGINNTATQLTVAAGTGGNFPAVSAGSGFFIITMEDSLGNREFIYCNDRSGDLLGSGGYPLQRGYGGSTAKSWSAGASVDLRWNTAAITAKTADNDARYGLIASANTWTAQNTFAAGTITTSKPFTITQTWNGGGIAFTGLLVNATNTASASGSLLADLQVGGTSQWKVDKAGAVTQLGALTAPSATFSGQITSTLTTGTAPFVVASTTTVANLDAASIAGGKTFASPGAIGGTTPGSAAFTTISASGQITSTLTTGTAPFVVASTTTVANLDAASIAGGKTFASPGAIGGTTPSTAVFTNIQNNGIAAASVVIGGGSGGNQTGVAPGTSGNVLVSNGSAWTSGYPVLTQTRDVLGGDVIMTSSSTWYTALSRNVGGSGVFLVTATMGVSDTVNTPSLMSCRITDGTTIFAEELQNINVRGCFCISAIVTNPAGAIQLQGRCQTTSGRPITFNQGGDSADTTLQTVRVA